MTTSGNATALQTTPGFLLPEYSDIKAAAARMSGIVRHTPLQQSHYLSRKYGARVLLKREDQQQVRSFKIRGAYNRIVQLSEQERRHGVVCASAGNHSQGLAFACNQLKIQGTVFMPENTPLLKTDKVRKFGGEYIKVVLTGSNFDEACAEARNFESRHGAIFIHPFDDFDVICGQGTLALEILQDTLQPVDALFTPVGGGGLAAGVATVFAAKSPATQLFGAEPLHAAAMKASITAGSNQLLDSLDPFVDGAATLKVGDLGFSICQRYLQDVLCIDESDVCNTLIDLYQEEGIVAELAGCLSIAALEQCREEIRGRTVVCLLTGSNNDFYRLQDILERAGKAI